MRLSHRTSWTLRKMIPAVEGFVVRAQNYRINIKTISGHAWDTRRGRHPKMLCAHAISEQT